MHIFNLSKAEKSKLLDQGTPEHMSSHCVNIRDTFLQFSLRVKVFRFVSVCHISSSYGFSFWHWIGCARKTAIHSASSSLYCTSLKDSGDKMWHRTEQWFVFVLHLCGPTVAAFLRWCLNERKDLRALSSVSLLRLADSYLQGLFVPRDWISLSLLRIPNDKKRHWKWLYVASYF